MISLLSSIWRRIIGSYLLWNSFFGLTVICPFSSEIPRSDQQYQYQQIKAKCGFIFKHICNEHLFIKTGLFFFFFGLVWCVLLFIWRVGWMVFFVYSYVGSLVFFYPFITDTYMWIQSMWNLNKTPRCHVAPKRKKANEVSSVDY